MIREVEKENFTFSLSEEVYVKINYFRCIQMWKLVYLPILCKNIERLVDNGQNNEHLLIITYLTNV